MFSCRCRTWPGRVLAEECAAAGLSLQDIATWFGLPASVVMEMVARGAPVPVVLAVRFARQRLDGPFSGWSVDGDHLVAPNGRRISARRLRRAVGLREADQSF